MATGRVLRFDEARSFGFTAADDGGEDVFLHTSVFDKDPRELRPGMRVEFEIMDGGGSGSVVDRHGCPVRSGYRLVRKDQM